MEKYGAEVRRLSLALGAAILIHIVFFGLLVLGYSGPLVILGTLITLLVLLVGGRAVSEKFSL